MGNLVLLDGNKISGGINYITPECYSTEEREIGCWIDGKPLYKKTIHFVNQTSTFQDYINVEEIQNIEKPIKIDFIANRSGTLYYCGNSSSRPELFTTDYFIHARIYNEYLQYAIGRYGTEISDIWFTLYYTKTTDTAGSGVWTPSGIPAVHYSTEEQVIGTWMGETLYEKTFITSNTAQNAEVNIDVSSLNIDTCVYVGGNYTRKGTGYSFKYPFGQLEPNSSPQIGSFIRYGDINKNITYKIVLSTNESTDYQHITIQYTKSS